jgi:hypothetical protein
LLTLPVTISIASTASVSVHNDTTDADDLVQETLLQGCGRMTIFVMVAREGLAVRHRDQRLRDLFRRVAAKSLRSSSTARRRG